MKNYKKGISSIPVQSKWIFIAATACTVFYLACGDAGTPGKEALLGSGDSNTVTFGPVPPTDISDPADPRLAAEFAWKEFVAVTWPAKVNTTAGMSGYYRCQPSDTDSSGSTGAGGVVVWETFYHRAELYPSYSGGVNKLPNQDTIPYYNYGGPISSIGNANQNLFNNLDETSEISLAYMYYTPLAKKADSIANSIKGTPTPAQAQMIAAAKTKASLLYEAKGNLVMYKYLDSTGYNNLSVRRPALMNNIKVIQNMQPTSSSRFTLPNGTMEVKATWRRYDASADNLNDFHWTVGIYYTNDSLQNTYANNDTLLLVGLHIIQKTPNVPTFTFATFEHVSNEQNGFRFLNTNPGDVTMAGYRPLPDSGIRTAARQFPIPGSGSKFNLVAFNTSMQNQLRSQYGQNNVWANYQLIGVQAVVRDDPDSVVPDQQFFLSNFATETNDALQFFQGGLAGPSGNVPNPDAAHVFVYSKDSSKYIAHTSGGCLGCHGSQGQFAGGDFSVISATGNNFYPDAVMPYPGGAVYNQDPTGFPLKHSAGAPAPTRKVLPVQKKKLVSYLSTQKKN